MIQKNTFTLFGNFKKMLKTFELSRLKLSKKAPFLVSQKDLKSHNIYNLT